MKFDFGRPPMEMFHMPTLHPGLHYVPPRPGWVMRPAQGGRVRGFAASENEAMRAMQRETIQNFDRRLMDEVMEINSTPVVMEQALESFRRQKFLDECNRAYERLKADPKEWAKEQAERDAWDATVGDGLEES